MNSEEAESIEGVLVYDERSLTAEANVLNALDHPAKLWIMRRLNQHPQHEMYLAALVNELRVYKYTFGNVQSLVRALAEAGLVSVVQVYLPEGRRKGQKMVRLMKYVDFTITDLMV